MYYFNCSFIEADIIPKEASDYLRLEMFSPSSYKAREAVIFIIKDYDVWETILELFVTFENDLAKLKRFIDFACTWDDDILDIFPIMRIMMDGSRSKHETCTAAQIFVMVLDKINHENPG